MAREISFSGGDITIIKILGISGQTMKGKILAERAGMTTAELIDTLQGLMMFDYILASRPNLRSAEDVDKTDFKVNQAIAKDIKDALRPSSPNKPEARKRRS